ncbi:hypothetical protein OG21DRAFT_815612 [Imleria badia]|nr:hypothetical protein OG21DRAFT_815612 [Imleria badia]
MHLLFRHSFALELVLWTFCLLSPVWLLRCPVTIPAWLYSCGSYVVFLLVCRAIHSWYDIVKYLSAVLVYLRSDCLQRALYFIWCHRTPTLQEVFRNWVACGHRLSNIHTSCFIDSALALYKGPPNEG